MAAVVPDEGRQLKGRKHTVLPWTFEKGRKHNLVTLVKGGEAALCGQIRLIHGSKIAVEIGHFIDGLAIGIAADQAEVIAELLFDFQNRAVVNGSSCRRILIVLKQQGIYEAACDDCATGI